MFGIFQNGRLWWARVPSPDGAVRVSLGTAQKPMAQRIAAVLSVLYDDPQHTDLVLAVAAKRVKARAVYDAHVTGQVAQLRARLHDMALEPLVAQWIAGLLQIGRVAEKTIQTYEMQVGTLVARVAWASELTPAAVREWLAALEVSSSTKRRYFDALRAFVTWAQRERGLFAVSPLATIAPPRNQRPRTRYWWHQDRLRVLDAVADERARVVLTLALGSGMEWGALQAVRGRDVLAPRTPDEPPAVYAHGTKSGYRSRVCVVDRWAWARIGATLQQLGALEPLVTMGGRALREALYAAQQRVGLGAPGDWHTLHDCRHTYAVCRLSGDDGEGVTPVQDVSDNLGHGGPEMVQRIYGVMRLQHRTALERRHEGVG